MSNKGDESNTFLGQGWGFPPTFSKGKKSVAMTVGKVDIDKSLEILLSTRLGERVMQPTYGCDLTALNFESLSTSFITYVKDLIRTAILYHEPRIKVLKIDLNTSKYLEGEILITVEYLIRTTNTRSNMVYPYYINEATNR